jgi:predicted transcriptional regulator of viral defense system
LATFRQRAFELAAGQYGYITSADAAKLEIPRIELVKLASRSGLRRVAYGLYRFDDLPSTRFDQFYEAVARVGRDAHLTGDAVLALHELGQVNPRRIRVGTPRRVERQLPDWIEMIKEAVPAESLTVYELVPSTTVAYAIAACVSTVMDSRLLGAVDRAENDGLITRQQAVALRTKIGAR